jgi:NADH:ubiquinone oxidoreductase subunit E
MHQKNSFLNELIEKYGRNQESLLPILQSVVEKQNYLSEDIIIDISRELDISAAQVYGTATFYSFLDIEPRGEYVIRLCKTITCEMRGKKQILQTLEDLLKIKLGETTKDKKFTLLETNCLGQCHKGPAMLINNEVFTELTPEKVSEIVNEFRKK